MSGRVLEKMMKGVRGPEATTIRSILASIVLACFLAFGCSPAYSAETITDQQSCNAALSAAETAIVNASIDSTAFRMLNDQLVKIRDLCAQQDFSNAGVQLRAFNKAIGK